MRVHAAFCSACLLGDPTPPTPTPWVFRLCCVFRVRVDLCVCPRSDPCAGRMWSTVSITMVVCVWVRARA